MKRFSVMLALLAATWAALAEGPDDQYLRIYNLIQEADSLNSSSQPAQALEKYVEAQSTLKNFQRVYPDWNANIVSFRLNYLGSRIDAASAVAPARTAPAPLNATFALPPRPSPPAPNEVETPLNGLKDQ